MTTRGVVFHYVDPHDEIASVLRGIKQAKLGRIGLVLPADADLFQRDVNIRLLHSCAKESGKELALITTDSVVRRLASEHGLPVFASTDKAWLPEQRGVTHLSPRQRALALFVAAAAVGCLLLVFTPRVTIVVTPPVRTLERTLTVPMRSVGGKEGVVLRTLEVTVEVVGSTPATGRRVEGTLPSVGTVLLYNDSPREVTVPKGALLATEGGQLYQTEAAVRVPPLKPEYFMEVAVGMQAGKAEVPIKASKPGSAGNVAAGRIRSLPKGPSGLKVLNPEPTQGGADRTVTYVTDKDIAQARQLLSGALRATAEDVLAQQVGSNAYVVLSLVDLQETGVAAQPAVGEEGGSVNVTLQGTARGRYVLLDELRQAARQQVEDIVPTGYQLMAPLSVAIEGEVAPTTQGETAGSLAVSVRIPVGGTVDAAAIARTVAGMTPMQVHKVLEQSGEVGTVEVRGHPRKHLPRWTPWIRVVVAGVEQGWGN